MNNVEQKRARRAIEFWARNANNRAPSRGQDEGDVVSKLPAMIMTNGLLAAGAFACDKEGGHAELLWEVALFLADRDGAGVLDWNAPHGQNPAAGLRAFLNALAQQDSGVLRRATVEALAYIAYLKRFAPAREREHHA